ncbi:MAG TPA: hypothetical protein VFY93_14130, partial [Planctomycetota bacterium]|nr:hypothetical protein [Planctomycetota bacterium]
MRIVKGRGSGGRDVQSADVNGGAVTAIPGTRRLALLRAKDRAVPPCRAPRVADRRLSATNRSRNDARRTNGAHAPSAPRARDSDKGRRRCDMTTLTIGSVMTPAPLTVSEDDSLDLA